MVTFSVDYGGNKAYYNSKRMERYNQKSLTIQDTSRTIQQPPKRTNSKKRTKKKPLTLKYTERSNPNLNTIETSSPNDLRIHFEPESNFVDKGTPGVGEYDISSPFVRPSYETYQKTDQVILVKINHIGGTSSFRSEEKRFVDGNSIYQPNASPGPGAYQLASQRNKKHLATSTYHENYDLIQQLLRNSRERTQSMPNYKIGVPQHGLEYNGLPKHLQEMYMNLNREKQESSIGKSIPLQRLIKLRKRAQKLPIVQNKNNATPATPQKKRYTTDKMTATLYRLDQQMKKQEQRQQKIRAILSLSPDSKSKTIQHESIDPFRGRTRRQMAFNKNMVNILYERARK